VKASARTRKTEIQHLRSIAWEAIGSATVGKAKEHRYRKVWEGHCWLYQTDSTGKLPHNAHDMLLTFSVAVREGQIGLRNQVKVQSVSKALIAVGQKYVLDGHQEPQQASPAKISLDLPIAHLLKKFHKEDPSAEPKLAVPMSTIQKISKQYNFSDHHRAVADLCIIAFFYLLRVREYTTPSTTAQQRKQTISLQKCDICMWRKGKILSPTASLANLLSAHCKH
jgi:hypothetical protein